MTGPSSIAVRLADHGQGDLDPGLVVDQDRAERLARPRPGRRPSCAGPDADRRVDLRVDPRPTRAQKHRRLPDRPGPPGRGRSRHACESTSIVPFGCGQLVRRSSIGVRVAPPGAIDQFAEPGQRRAVGDRPAAEVPGLVDRPVSTTSAIRTISAASSIGEVDEVGRALRPGGTWTRLGDLDRVADRPVRAAGPSG